MTTQTFHSAQSTISVWVVEDDSSLRSTLSCLLNRVSDLHCSETFVDFEALQDYFDKSEDVEKPDIILMDIMLPGRSGVEALPWLRQRLPHIPILMLTIVDRDEVILDALRHGASGYVLKDTPIDQILLCIREAYRGSMLMPARVTEKVLPFFQTSIALDGFGLSEREKEILRLLRSGFSQKRAATQLFISPHTVNSHLSNIYKKLDVHSEKEALNKVFPVHPLMS